MMEPGTLRQFCLQLETASSAEDFGKACKSITCLLEGFSRSREDLATIAGAVRKEATRFAVTATISVPAPAPATDGKTKVKPTEPQTMQVGLREYADGVARWVESLPPELATVRPPAAVAPPADKTKVEATTPPAPAS